MGCTVIRNGYLNVGSGKRKRKRAVKRRPARKKKRRAVKRRSTYCKKRQKRWIWCTICYRPRNWFTSNWWFNR